MSRRKRWGIVGSLLGVLLAFGGWLAFRGGDGDLLWFDGASVNVAATDAAGQPVGESGSGTTESSSGPQAGSATSAPPHIQPFARQPGVEPNAPAPSPTAGIEIAEGTDGCDHAYGDRDVCVPWTFPAGVTDKCGWLKSHGFEPLRITGGRDRHGLDRNGDGIACGQGD